MFAQTLKCTRLVRRPAARLLAALALALCGSAAVAQDFVYIVRAGDNPWNITRRYLKNIDYWPRIQDYNQILDPQAIRPGTVLRIPVAWMRGERTSAYIVDVRGEVEQQVARIQDLTRRLEGLRTESFDTLQGEVRLRELQRQADAVIDPVDAMFEAGAVGARCAPGYWRPKRPPPRGPANRPGFG